MSQQTNNPKHRKFDDEGGKKINKNINSHQMVCFIKQSDKVFKIEDVREIRKSVSSKKGFKT